MERMQWLPVALATAVLLSCGDRSLDGSRAGFYAEPDSVDFGPTALGHAKKKTFRLTNGGRASVNVLRVESHTAGIEVDALAPFPLSAGETRELQITFTPRVEGPLTGLVEVTTDSGAVGAGPVQVSVSGLGVNAVVSLKNRILDFGDVEVGTVKMGHIEVANESEVEAPLRFELEGPDVAMFTAAEAGQALLLQPQEARSIPVAFSPDRLAAAQAFARVEVCGICPPEQVELRGFGISSVVDVQPLRINFGRVAPGAQAEQMVTVTNLGTEVLDFSGFSWTGAPGPYDVQQPTPQPIRPGETVRATVTFSPQAHGPAPTSMLQVGVTAKNAKGIKVPVSGEGGQSCVLVLPRQLDFGLVPEGMSATKRVDLINRCGEPVQVAQMEVVTSQGGYFSLAQPGQTLALAAGAVTPVPLVFTPKPGSGLSGGTFRFKVLQGAAISQQEVGLSGSTQQFAPCQYRLVPPSVDFGLVQVGTEVQLGVGLLNEGTDKCFVASMNLAVGSDAAFSSDGQGPMLLEPGQRAVLIVRFKPNAVGSYSALAEAHVNHPLNGLATAQLTGRGVQGCFQLQPATVDFGRTRVSCGLRQRTVLGINGCTGPVTINSATVARATSSELALQGAPGLPMTLAAGTQVAFVVSYQPVDDGIDAAALLVDAGQGGLNSVGLTGHGLVNNIHTDRFMQESAGKVDLLFVVDNSGSMMEEQQNLASNFSALLSAAQSSGIDYHIAVTTTGLEGSPGGWSMCPGGVEGGENGRLFPADNSSPRVISRSTPNAAQVFANNVKVGWCHWNEQGLEAAYRALSEPLLSAADDPRTPLFNDGNLGFVRAEARLAIIVVSDEEDASPQSVSFYETYFRSLKGNDPTLFSFSAIVAPANLALCPTASSSGTRYASLAASSGGITENICTQSWAGSLTNLSNSAFGPKRQFKLTELPDDVGQIQVEVDGIPVSTGWVYDGPSNSIVFDQATVPGPGSAIDVSYPLGC